MEHNSSKIIRKYNTDFRKKLNNKIIKLKNKSDYIEIYNIIYNDIGNNYSTNRNGIFINLNTLSDNLKTFRTTTLVDIQKIMNNVKTQRLIDKEILLKVLTDIYTLKYLESINQGNAVSYHEYIKYVSPKTNIYYKQYL